MFLNCFFVEFSFQIYFFQIKTPEAEYDWGAVVNFKKVQEIIPGRKNKQGQNKTQTKVKVDILLHVIPSENENGDSIPKPCTDDQVNSIYIYIFFVELILL